MVKFKFGKYFNIERRTCSFDISVFLSLFYSHTTIYSPRPGFTKLFRFRIKIRLRLKFQNE